MKTEKFRCDKSYKEVENFREEVTIGLLNVI